MAEGSDLIPAGGAVLITDRLSTGGNDGSDPQIAKKDGIFVRQLVDGGFPSKGGKSVGRTGQGEVLGGGGAAQRHLRWGVSL
jgi:hypothetical protein